MMDMRPLYSALVALLIMSVGKLRFTDYHFEGVCGAEYNVAFNPISSRRHDSKSVKTLSPSNI